MTRFVVALLVAAVLVVALLAQTPEEDRAWQYVKDVADPAISKLRMVRADLAWRYATNITDYNQQQEVCLEFRYKRKKNQYLVVVVVCSLARFATRTFKRCGLTRLKCKPISTSFHLRPQIINFLLYPLSI